MIEPCEEVKRVERRYEKALDDMEKHYKDVLEQIRVELYEDYESYSASEVNFEFACGIKRAIDTIDYHIYHINHKAESEVSE